MTQRSKIFNFLNKKSPKGFTSTKIFKALDIERFSSVRGRLSELKKDGVIQSRKSKFLKRLEYFIEDEVIYYRKIVKTTESERRTSKQLKIFALTYEDNKRDRFLELVNAIKDAYPQAESTAEFNYDDQLKQKNPNTIYPEIKVGLE